MDPGYQGSLQFSIYNAGTETVALAVGQPAFLIWFADLDQATIDPYGAQHQHANQRGITAQDRLRMRQPVPSPTALQRQLGIFEYRWEIFRAAAKYFILPAVAALLAGFVLWVLTTGFPNTVPFRDIKRLLRSLNEEQPQMTAPATTATPVLGSGQPPALRIEIATPSPAATQTASISPEPSISVKRSKHLHH